MDPKTELLLLFIGVVVSVAIIVWLLVSGTNFFITEPSLIPCNTENYESDYTPIIVLILILVVFFVSPKIIDKILDRRKKYEK